MTEQSIQQTSEVYLKIIDQVKEKMLSGNIICNVNDLESMVLDEYKVIILEGLNTLAKFSNESSTKTMEYVLLYKQISHYIEDMLQYREQDCFLLNYEERELTLGILTYDGKWQYELADNRDIFNPLENKSFHNKNNAIRELIENFILIKNSGISLELLESSQKSVKEFFNTWLKTIEKEKAL